MIKLMIGLWISVAAASAWSSGARSASYREDFEPRNNAGDATSGSFRESEVWIGISGTQGQSASSASFQNSGGIADGSRLALANAARNWACYE